MTAMSGLKTQRWTRATPRSAVMAVALLGLAGCAGEAATSAPGYDLESCRRVSLFDAETGARIVGAEDMAIDRATGRLFISAYDRRAVEKAARKRAFQIPSGGVYQTTAAAIAAAPEGGLTIAPLARAGEISGGLRPHGLEFDDVAGELLFVNRAYQREGRSWRMTPRIERVGADGAVYVGKKEPAPCAANDLVADDHGALVTFDHADCGAGGAIEDVFGLKRSGVARGGAAVFDGARFANGLTRTLTGDLVLAATRDKALIVLTQSPDGYVEDRRIELPGGPDNLTIADDGGVVAAVHPSLMRMGLHRKLGLGAAPSRIVKSDPENGSVSILFDDPKGAIFQAATVAVEWGDALVLGSVTDDGVAVCRNG